MRGPSSCRTRLERSGRRRPCSSVRRASDPMLPDVRIWPRRHRPHTAHVMRGWRCSGRLRGGSWLALLGLALLCLGFMPGRASSEPTSVAVLDIDGADRAGDRRLRRARLRQGARAGRGPDRPAHGHAGRSRRFDARHHQGDPRRAGAGGRLRRAERRARRERRHLHPLCLPRRGDGARHQSRRGDPGPDRRRRLSAGPQPGTAGGRAGEAGGEVTAEPASAPHAERRDGGQDRQRRGRVHPQSRPAARPQRRLGRAGGARGREPVGAGGAEAERDRSDRARPRRAAAKLDGRQVEIDGGERTLATARRARSTASSPTGAPSCSASSPIPTSPTS